jgi:hypothetical protein
MGWLSQDVNLALGYSLLRNPVEWMDDFRKWEKGAIGGMKGPGSEKRIATILRQIADQTV